VRVDPSPSPRPCGPLCRIDWDCFISTPHDRTPNQPNRRVRTRTHSGMGGAGPQGPPLSRSSVSTLGYSRTPLRGVNLTVGSLTRPTSTRLVPARREPVDQSEPGAGATGSRPVGASRRTPVSPRGATHRRVSPGLRLMLCRHAQQKGPVSITPPGPDWLNVVGSMTRPRGLDGW
jgi:hypothetical protein